MYFCFLHIKNYNTIVTPFKQDQNMMLLPLRQFFQLGISGTNTNKTLKYMDLEKMRNHSILLKWDFLKISHSSGGGGNVCLLYNGSGIFYLRKCIWLMTFSYLNCNEAMNIKVLQGWGIEINEVLTNLRNLFEEKSLTN